MTANLLHYSFNKHITIWMYSIYFFLHCELLDAMNMDCGIPLASLQVDGGMTVNNLLMQLQADILGISVGK